MFQLPDAILQKIYEYDGTYRNHYDIVMLEIVILSEILKCVYAFAYEIVTCEKFCKRFLRFITKQQIRKLAYLTKTRLPRKFTKRKGMLGIVFNTIYKPNMRYRKYRNMILS